MNACAFQKKRKDNNPAEGSHGQKLVAILIFIHSFNALSTRSFIQPHCWSPPLPSVSILNWFM